MNKLKISTLFAMIALISCSKNNSCDVSNPLSDLDWLEQMVDNFKQDNVNQRVGYYIYNNKDVYLVEDCLDICADFLTIAYNCEGESICEFGGIDGRNTCPDFEANAVLQEILYEE